MRKPLLISLAMLVSAPAFSQVLFQQNTNRNPDGYFSDGVTTNGSQYYAQALADDFTLAAPSTITKLVFWGSSENFVSEDLSNFNSWDFQILNSSFSPVFITNLPKVVLNQVATGLTNGNGGIEYELSIQMNQVLAAGTYWLHVGSKNADPDGDGWIWSTSVGNNNAAANFFDGNGWISGPGEPGFAFKLEGQPVPEPATLATLALGGLALLRRRRVSA